MRHSVLEMQHLYAAGKSTVEIAAQLGIKHASSVAYALKRAGVTLRGRGCRNGLSAEERLSRIATLYADGKTVKAIRAELRVSSRDVAIALKHAQLPRRTRSQVLTPQQQATVARRYAKYATYAELCKEFDCAPSVIQAALKKHGVQTRSGWAKYRTVDWEDRKGRTVRFKSSWEQAFAQLLDSVGAEWDYEPEHFTLKLCRRYTPDFRVQTANGPLYVEVKGWLDDRTERRLAEFRKQYPNKPFYLVGPTDLADRGLVPVAFAKHPQAGRVTRASARLGLNALDLFNLLEAA